jgi:ATP-dependent DNA helicase RecQ
MERELADVNTLQTHFGLSSFRLGQREIIGSVLAAKDVLAVLPTGGGKSLCYQYPAVVAQKLVVVISPLIALMKDQVASLKKFGIPAGCLHSGQSEEEKRTVFRDLSKGGPFLLYLSPERVQKDGFQSWIQQRPIALFAIDEAHCVSQWGHDFREEYSKLNILKSLRPDVPVLALTASATPLVLADISKNLNLKSPDRHVHGFYRPNLYYQVEICEEDTKLSYLRQSIEQTPNGRILVYCGTRKSTEDISNSLQKYFPKVGFYHAGLSADQRSETQESYANGDVRILVATNAFGMGIDHPDVRLVVHYQMPGNIDALYQEMGRAGRDGKHSTCLMLYSKRDKGLQSYFIQNSDAPVEIKRSRWSTLDAIVGYAEGSECRHSEILTYYKDAQRIDSCGHCDTCDPTSQRKVAKPMRMNLKIEKVSKRGRKKREAQSANDALDEIQKLRFADLKEWRKGKAKELDVAAFMIFSDRTLRQLATDCPSSKSSLLQIHGIGESKLEAFGDELLLVIGCPAPGSGSACHTARQSHFWIQ